MPHQPPTRVTFLTHAPTPDLRRAAFPLDSPLTLAPISWHPPSVQIILTAPEHRTRATAEALSLQATVDSDLRDLDYADWCGLTLEAIPPGQLHAWLTDPAAAPHGGESLQTLLARAATWLSSRPPGHTLALTHPAFVRAAVVHALCAPPQAFWRIDIPPLTLTDLRANGPLWTLRSLALPLQTRQTP